MADWSSDTLRLPGGYAAEDGRVHADVEIASLDGNAEDALADAPADACAARLVTLLLANSVRRVGPIRDVTPALVRDLLVEDREYLIMRLFERTLGPRLWVALECPHGECGKGLEVPLMLDEIAFEPRPVAARRFRLDADPPLSFRLPTGGDQELAAASGLTEPEALRDFLLARCLDRTEAEAAALPLALKDAVERRIEELAPDVVPEADADCPECGRPFTARIDLAFLAVRELRSHALDLEREVHLLAWNYHWSERDILALPRRKRRRYVRIVEEELETQASR